MQAPNVFMIGLFRISNFSCNWSEHGTPAIDMSICTVSVRRLEKLQDQTMFLGRKVCAHAHMMNDGFPLPVTSLLWITNIVAAHAVLSPGSGSILAHWRHYNGGTWLRAGRRSVHRHICDRSIFLATRGQAALRQCRYTDLLN